MKKIIQKVFSEKKYWVPLSIILLAAVCYGGYVIMGIVHSIKVMESHYGETVTYFPTYPIVQAAGEDAALIKKGEYLVKAGDCIACHTNTGDKGKPFAGGLPMYTPFGTIYTPNITPDKETGIGNWSDAQFIKAMREGISPQGEYYFPAFPYLYFSNVTTEDLKAIKAYLNRIPAVSQPNRQNEMVGPFQWRFLQLGWRLLFFHPSATPGMKKEGGQAEPKPMSRGEYLVEGLAHCAMCHTPSYNLLSETLPLGAPIRKYNLTGAKVSGFLAPDISKNNLGNIPDEEILKVFLENKMIGGGKIQGPMLEANEDSFKQLEKSDLVAIVDYIKSVASELPPKPSGGVAGQGTYEAYCSGCHSTGAGGAPKLGDSAAWEPRLQDGIDAVYTKAIQGFGGMPAKGACFSCSDDEIKQAVDYMVAAAKGGSGSAGTTMSTLPPPKPLTMADNKNLYEKNCSVCHDNGFGGAPKLGDKTAWQPIIKQGFVKTYENVVTGRHGHPLQGGCAACTDGDIKAALKYIMQQGATNENFSLW